MSISAKTAFERKKKDYQKFSSLVERLKELFSPESFKHGGHLDTIMRKAVMDEFFYQKEKIFRKYKFCSRKTKDTEVMTELKEFLGLGDAV